MVKIVLRDYLRRLTYENQGKMFVPKVKDFIIVTETTESNFYKFLRNEQTNINRSFVDASLKLLRSYGFDTQINDIIKFEEE